MQIENCPYRKPQDLPLQVHVLGTAAHATCFSTAVRTRSGIKRGARALESASEKLFEMPSEKWSIISRIYDKQYAAVELSKILFIRFRTCAIPWVCVHVVPNYVHLKVNFSQAVDLNMMRIPNSV